MNVFTTSLKAFARPCVVLRRRVFGALSSMSGFRTHLIFLSCVWLVALNGYPCSGQEVTESAPTLTLDQAIAMATAQNTQLKSAALEVKKSKLDVAATKTQRLPAISGHMFGGALLTPLQFTIPAGSLGTFPATGPIPASDAQIGRPAGAFSGFLMDQIVQPLTPLYKLHLAIREKQLTTESDRVKYDAVREQLIQEVKQTYYGILQAESALRTSRASVRQYHELDRIVTERISQSAALESDGLEVQTKLAQEQYTIVQSENEIQTQKEHLNYLLGRDISTPFRTQEVPSPSSVGMDLKTAQQKALAQRPEIRQAEIDVEKAHYGRRLAKAQFIPDIALAVHYISPFNTGFLQKDIVTAGFEMSWQPFQWGKRKEEMIESRIQYEQSRLQLQEARSKVLLDVNNRFRKLQQARALLEVARAAQKSAAEKLREVTQKYAEKTVLLRDVFEQQAEVASANNEYENALLAFANSKAEFDKAVGGN